ncbi:hypothetical protein ACH347_39485 [Saccharopolyspora sp. 5N102]|uniref:hypothetical protein n=1 Tax=Saccharopolyspora sp. 5N102 TaxID=3375155 RepID=UPI0037B575BA
MLAGPATMGGEAVEDPLVDLDRFMAAAAALGFTERVRFANGSQVPIRLLIQTGRCLDQLTLADLAEFTVACRWAGICGLNSVRCNKQRDITQGVPDTKSRAIRSATLASVRKRWMPGSRTG